MCSSDLQPVASLFEEQEAEGEVPPAQPSPEPEDDEAKPEGVRAQALCAVETMDGAAKKLLQSNMAAQLKNSKVPEKKEAWRLYQEATRGPEKDTLLGMFKLDKTCKWSNSYTQEKIVDETMIESEAHGYGTKPEAYVCAHQHETLSFNNFKFCLCAKV